MISTKVLLPSEILVKQKCSLCHNYLSNGPVVISMEHGKSCGNCSKCLNKNKSVPSLYNVVAKHCIFRCHNHFNGCKAILNFNDSHDECHNKKYPCPRCSFLGSGAQLSHHFSETHNENFLCTNHFIFLNNSSQTSSFLFNHNNILFAIEISCKNQIFIKIVNICENPNAKEITLHFSQMDQHNKLVTLSETFPSNNNYIRSELRVARNEIVFVRAILNFDRKLKEDKDYFDTLAMQLQTKMTSIRRKESEIEEEEKAAKEKRELLMSITKDLVSSPEVFFLKSILKVTVHSLFSCNQCSAFLNSETYMSHQKRLVCGKCANTSTTNRRHWQPASHIFEQFRLPCDWPHCEVITNIQDYLTHKQICKYRLYDCPAQSCEFKGKACDVVEHWHLQFPKLYLGNIVSVRSETYQFYWLQGEFKEFLKVRVRLHEIPGNVHISISVDERCAVLPIAYKLEVHKLSRSSSNLASLKQYGSEKFATIEMVKGRVCSLKVISNMDQLKN